MSKLVCLHRIQRRRMYVKFRVSTQDTEETNVCQVYCVYTGYTEDKCMWAISRKGHTKSLIACQKKQPSMYDNFTTFDNQMSFPNIS